MPAKEPDADRANLICLEDENPIARVLSAIFAGVLVALLTADGSMEIERAFAKQIWAVFH